MRIIRGLEPVAPELRGASAAIGNFDGVHRGHRVVLDLARREGAPLAVVTFEPHPRRFFRPETPAFELMDVEAKARRLEKLGVETLFAAPFDAALSAMSPDAFCETVLADAYGLSHVAVGADFRFGAGRAGDGAALGAAGARLGFDVTVADLLADGEVEISSTAIRTALAEGRPEAAAAMLGHLHRIVGTVEKGHQRGRGLGYPTANLVPTEVMLPRWGVYAVRFDVLDGPHAGAYDGVCSIGERPTFGAYAPNVETFVLDFSGDLYGATVSVGLVAFLRPELKFDGVEPLIAQMDEDTARAREILAAAGA